MSLFKKQACAVEATTWASHEQGSWSGWHQKSHGVVAAITGLGEVTVSKPQPTGLLTHKKKDLSLTWKKDYLYDCTLNPTWNYLT